MFSIVFQNNEHINEIYVTYINIIYITNTSTNILHVMKISKAFSLNKRMYKCVSALLCNVFVRQIKN